MSSYRSAALKLAPEQFADDLGAWINFGLQPDNDMVWHVICSDVGAIVGLSGPASDGWRTVHSIQLWLWNFAPAASYGSKEAARAWAERGGLKGKATNDR